VSGGRRVSRRGLVAGGVALAGGAIAGRALWSGGDGPAMPEPGRAPDPLLRPGHLRKAIGLAPFVGLGVAQGGGDFDVARGRFVRGGRPANVQIEANLQAPGLLTGAGGTPGLLADTGTDVVRLWAPWDQIMGAGPGRFDGRTLEALDANIHAANTASPRPVRIVLVAARFPGWVTGCAAPDADGTFRMPADDEPRAAYVARFHPSRRAAAGAVWDDLRRGWRCAGEPDPGRPAVHRLPGSVGDPADDGLGHVRPGGAWTRWIEFLARRYHPDPARRATVHFPDAPPNRLGAHVDLLEVMNEPNFEGWPQFVTLRDGRAVADPADARAGDERRAYAVATTAEMLRSAVALCATVNAGARVPLLLGGPGTSDAHRADEASAVVLGYDRFLRRLVAELGDGLPAEPRFVWTHHHYKDTEQDRTGAPGAPGAPADERTNGAAWVVRLLRGATEDGAWRGWRGWPSGRAQDAGLALTEGGCRRNRDAPTADEQVRRLRASFERMRDGPLGAGVVLFTTFLAWQDESADNTGYLLRRDAPGVGDLGRARGAPADLRPLRTPLYAAWRALRSSR
jgi:hypothetical protein